MTREERDNALKVLKNYDLNFHRINGMLFSAEEIANAFDMVIKSLEQEPCEDCISRQAVLEIQAKYAEDIGATKFWQMRDDIKALPSVTPQPKTDTLDKIRAEIDEQYDKVHPYNISCAEGLEMALEIIEKYKSESENV